MPFKKGTSGNPVSRPKGSVYSLKEKFGICLLSTLDIFLVLVPAQFSNKSSPFSK